MAHEKWDAMLDLDVSLNRRSLLRRAAGAGLAIPVVSGLLAACGGDDDDDDTGGDEDTDSGADPTATTAEDSSQAEDEPTEATDDGETEEPAATEGDSGAAPSGGTVIFNGGTNLSGLDPQTTGATVSWYVLDQIFDRLVRLDADTSEPAPSLAESFEVSDDGLSYTFTLRSGVLFHNGREMTSADVKQSFERIQDPDVPAVAKGYFAALDSIETPDDLTVVLNYSELFAPLLIALTRLETAIVPMEEVEKTEQWETHPIGSGPFKFESYVKDQGAVMLKNEDYWEEGLPLLDSVEQRVIPEDETAVVNVRTGDIHVTQVPPKDIETIEAEEGVQAVSLTSTFWPHMSMNCSRPPFDDIKVRQAIKRAVNREDISALAFFDAGLISNTMLPEGNPFRAEVDGWGYDLEAAQQLMAESSVPDGFSTVMRITSGNAWQLAAAQIVQQNLAEIGIEIELEQIESTTWFTEVFTNHEYDMSMVAHVSKVDPDLSMLDILHSGEFGTKNYTNTDSAELNELLEQGRSTIDPEERKAIYADAQKLFVEESGYLVLILQNLIWGVRDEVQNFKMLPTGELRWKEASLRS